MIGRRVATVGAIERPGDYCGPIAGFTGKLDNDDPSSPPRPAVFFLLPTAGGENPLWRLDPEHPANGLHHVTAPPHSFRECADGSLEIRASIGAYGLEGRGGPYVWHGFLDEGHVWRTA